MKLGMNSEAGWIHSPKICVYTVACSPDILLRLLNVGSALHPVSV
nr:hypothetical protein [Nostoc sp. EkiNYC01]